MLGNLTEKQSFPLACGPRSKSEQSRWYYSRVIPDQEIARTQEFRKFVKVVMRPAFAQSVNHHQPRMITRFDRVLRDELRR